MGTEMQAGFRRIFLKQPRVGQPPPTAGEARGPGSCDAQHLENKNGKNSGDEIGAHAYLRSQDIAAERAGG